MIDSIALTDAPEEGARVGVGTTVSLGGTVAGDKVAGASVVTGIRVTEAGVLVSPGTEVSLVGQSAVRSMHSKTWARQLHTVVLEHSPEAQQTSL